MNQKTEVSAGGVVYKKTDEGIRVLISKHSGYHKWVLPKGRVERGESLENTAIREVEEEVGVKAKIVAQIGTPESYIYTFNGERISKTVHYFLMEYISGSHDDHDFEMEEVEWVSIDEAIARMGFEGAKNILEKARGMIE